MTNNSHPPRLIDQNRILYADLLRVVAILGVVLIHCTGELTLSQGKIPYDHWWVGNVVYSSFKWSVPLFVILSGMLILHDTKNLSPWQFLKKRFSKIVPPFIFWMIVYIIYNYRYNFSSFSNLTLKNPFFWIWDNIYRFFELPWRENIFPTIITGDVYYHFWFIPMILGVYLLTPFFKVYLKSATQEDLNYFLLIWFLNGSIYTYCEQFFIVEHMSWMSYGGFFFFGYYIRKYTIPKERWLMWIGFICFISTPFIVAYRCYLKGSYDDRAYVYLSPNIILGSFALVVWLIRFDWSRYVAKFPKFFNLMTKLSTMSFAVYFIHALLIDLLKNGYLWGFYIYNNRLGPPDCAACAIHPIFGAPIFFTVVALLSFLSVYLLRKLPKSAWYIG